MSKFFRFALPALAALFLAARPAGADGKALPTFNDAVRAEAPKVLKTLKDRGYKNVGVLKFLVGNEGAKLRDNFGPINRTIADRLEMALYQCLRTEDGIGIIYRASDVVEAKRKKNPRLTHLTDEGRAEFFGFKQPPFFLPWNPEEFVQPDAFLTGEAKLSADFKRLTVKVQVFGNSGADKLRLQDVRDFVSAVDPETLIESGVSFEGARGPLEDGMPLDIKVDKAGDSPEAWFRRADGLLNDMKNLPVQIEILYSDQPAKVAPNPYSSSADVRDNVQLYVRDPLASEKVVFRLTNRGTEPYAVVVKVNGQNTIYREEKPAKDCHKWIVKPGKSAMITGFLKRDDKKEEEFKVRSDSDSRLEQVRYGNSTGTFSFTLFRPAKTAAEQAKANKEKERDVEDLVISRGTEQLTTQIPPSNLDSFRGQLAKLTKKEQETAGSRGVVVAGDEKDKTVQTIDFNALPDPVFSVTIRYYDPKVGK